MIDTVEVKASLDTLSQTNRLHSLSPVMKWSTILFFLIMAFLLGFFEYTHAPYIYNSNSSRRDFETLLFLPPLVYG